MRDAAGRLAGAVVAVLDTDRERRALDALRQVKKDVSEMRKGTECGMSFDGFDGLQVDDQIQCFTMVQVPASLHSSTS